MGKAELESFGGDVFGSILNFGLNELAADSADKRARGIMDYQNSLNRQNWNLNNAYNTPARQRARLEAAGLNPDLMYQHGAAGLQSAAAPNTAAVASGAKGGTVDSSLGSRAIAAASAAAQAKNLDAKTEGENLNNQYLRDTMEERVRQIALANHWTEEQTEKTVNEIGLIIGNMNVLQKQVDVLMSQKALTDKEISWYDRHMQAEIDDIVSSKKYKDSLAKMTDSERSLLDSTFEDLKKITNLNASYLEKSLGLLDKYGDAQAVIGMLSQIIDSATGLISSFKGFGKKDGISIVNNIPGKK